MAINLQKWRLLLRRHSFRDILQTSRHVSRWRVSLRIYFKIVFLFRPCEMNSGKFLNQRNPRYQIGRSWGQTSEWCSQDNQELVQHVILRIHVKGDNVRALLKHCLQWVIVRQNYHAWAPPVASAHKGPYPICFRRLWFFSITSSASLWPQG